MSAIKIAHPHDPHSCGGDVICDEKSLTGKTRLNCGFFRTRVEFEVVTYRIVDHCNRQNPKVLLRRYLQKTEWIRA